MKKKLFAFLLCFCIVLTSYAVPDSAGKAWEETETENITIKNDLVHPAIWHDDLGFSNLSLKFSSEYFYSTLSLGIHEGLLFAGSHMIVTRAGLGAELPLDTFFLNVDITAGQIILNCPRGNANGASFIVQVRFSISSQFLKDLGIFGGISYDYILSPYNDSPRLGKNFGISALGWSDNRHTHKIGFFGGIQL
jgi:hypothetical protein